MTLLELEDVTKVFGGLVAVNDLSFTVEEGSVVGLIGPNGAGKTTVFNCITGNYAPERGTIRFAGRNITGLAPHRIVELGIARTFQSIRLFGRLPVVENVLAGRHCRMKAGLFACMLHTPGQRREERAAVAGWRTLGGAAGRARPWPAPWKNWRSSAWRTRPKPWPMPFPTATSACWRSRAPWPRTRAC